MQRRCLGKKDEVRFEIFLRCFLKTQVEDSQKTKRWVLGANAGISFRRDANALKLAYGDGCTGREADIPEPYNLKRWSVWFVD